MTKKDPSFIENDIPIITCEQQYISGFTRLDAFNFVQLVRLQSPKYLFRIAGFNTGNSAVRIDHQTQLTSIPEFFIYFIENGVAFVTENLGCPTYGEFSGALAFFSKNETGFSNIKDFTRPFLIGIFKAAEWKTFQESGFYECRDIEADRTNFKNYLSAAKMGYTFRSDFDLANIFGIPTKEEYLSFVESDFIPEKIKALSKIRSDKCSNLTLFQQYWHNKFKGTKPNGVEEKKAYQEYIEARKGKFPDKATFQKSRVLGFSDYDEYQQFIGSGCNNKAEYVVFLDKMRIIREKIPPLLAKITEEIKSTYQESRWDLYLQKRYLMVEKLIEWIFLLVNNRPYGEGEPLIDAIIKHFVEQGEIHTIDINEFHKLRRLRNDVVHENVKVSVQEAAGAKSFFDTLEEELIHLRDNLISGKKVKRIEKREN